MIRRLRSLPLRIRLVAVVVLLAAAGLAVTGAIATSSLHSYLLQRLDGQLVGAQIPPNACTEFGAGPDGGPQDARGFPSQFYVAQYTPHGTRRCAQDATSTDAAPRVGALTPTRAASLSKHPFTVGSSDGDDVWRVAVTIAPDGDIRVVASSLRDLHNTVARLIALETVVGAVVLALLAGVGYLVIRQSLKPLLEVEETAVAIAGGDLSRRVADHDPRTEVGRLTSALNAMLGQIEHAFARQDEAQQTAQRSETKAREAELAARASEDRMRRFVADASHELRTPLTSIRGFAELFRQGAVGGSHDLARVMGRIEAEATRMGLLVDDLLLLARLDQERPLKFRPVDLLSVATDVVHDAQTVMPDRSISLEVTSNPPVVQGDEARLRQVMHNLMANALRYAPAETPITVRLGHDVDNAVIEMVDHGPGLSQDARRRVFERFYRVDASRTRDAGGTGLGLSIVAALVAAHGGSVSVSETDGGGATFRVQLPCGRQAPR